MLDGNFCPPRGANDGFVAPFSERASKKLLAPALAVDIGGIEEIDAGIERSFHHGGRAIGVNPPPEIIAADADNWHFQGADPSFLRADSVAQTEPRRLCASPQTP